MAKRYKYQGKYTFIDNSNDVKITPMAKALIERVLSSRHYKAGKEFAIEWEGDYIFIKIDGHEYFISYDIEFSSEIVTDVSWGFFRSIKNEKGEEYSERISDGYYKFWNADYPAES